MSKTILNYRDRLDQVSTVTKTRYENYVIDCIDMVYAKNKTDLSWSVEQGTIYDEN